MELNYFFKNFLDEIHFLFPSIPFEFIPNSKNTKSKTIGKIFSWIL